MKIDSIRVKNFKAFVEESFVFPSTFTAIIGDNATGKTSTLEALSIVLGTYLMGTKDVKYGLGGRKNRPLLKSEIRHQIMSPDNIEQQLPVEISAECCIDGSSYDWTRKQANKQLTYKEARDFIAYNEEQVCKLREGEEVTFPLIAYHGTGRLSNELLERAAYKKISSRLDGYYAALDPRSTKKQFIDWFKTYEDSILKFNKDRSLYDAFTEAVTTVIPEWNEIHFSWHLDELVGQTEAGEWMAFSGLSDGYQAMLSLVADLAYRCITLNPHLGKVAIKETAGVVLIDEIDMHLHPKWQRHVVNDLKKAFPKVQFIVTTHSPFIVQSLKADELINLDEGSGEDPYKKSLEDIVEDEMHVEDVRRSAEFLKMQEVAGEYFELLSSSNNENNVSQLSKLKNQLDELESKFSSDPAYVALMKAERKSSGL